VKCFALVDMLAVIHRKGRHEFAKYYAPEFNGLGWRAFFFGLMIFFSVGLGLADSEPAKGVDSLQAEIGEIERKEPTAERTERAEKPEKAQTTDDDNSNSFFASVDKINSLFKLVDNIKLVLLLLGGIIAFLFKQVKLKLRRASDKRFEQAFDKHFKQAFKQAFDKYFEDEIESLKNARNEHAADTDSFDKRIKDNAKYSEDIRQEDMRQTKRVYRKKRSISIPQKNLHTRK